MSRTHIYPLEPELSKASERLPGALLARARRHPRLALLFSLLCTLAVSALHMASGSARHATCLYVVPVISGAALLPTRLAMGVAFVCVLLSFLVDWQLASGGSPLLNPLWLGQLPVIGSIYLVLHITLALRRALLREGRQCRVLDGLRAVTAAITSSLDLHHVLDTALAQAQSLTRADPVAIWLVDRAHSELVLSATRARIPERRVRADATRIPLDSMHLLAESIRQRVVMTAEADTTVQEEGLEACLIGVSRMIVIPLVTHGTPMGALVAGFPMRFDTDALQVLREIASDAAMAIENAQLYSEARRHVIELEAMRAQAERKEQQARFLAEAGQLFTMTLDVRATMEAVVTKAAELLGDTCLILERLPGEETLSVAACYEDEAIVAHSLRQHLTAHPVSVGSGLLGRSASTGQACIAHGRPAAPGELGEAIVALGVRGMIAVPLWGRGRVRGVLVAAYYGEERLPTEEDLQLAVLLADRAAVAIENAALFEETQRAGVALEAWGHELERRVEMKTRELRDAQRGLLRAERLASIGQLAATVAHELRNPLNVIKVAHFALEQGCSPEREKRHLDAIARQVAASSRIINGLLDFARDSPPQYSLVDLGALLHQVLADADLPQEIHVSTEIPASLPPLLADREQIAQVLSNIIDNAVQVMPQGGELAIHVWWEEWAAYISVRDTGPGIPEEVRSRIFEPLFTTRTKGTGLGLAIARRIIEAHGGEITASTSPAGGATFTIMLPLPESAHSRESASSSA
ncbi:MAG: GAF domain-containing protein [Armatimonadetes bacterium]|nr:GAF domain-containing protein [Armatimonadota bacterium]